MRGRNVTFGRLWLAALAAIGLTGLTRAALTEAQQESLSYYSTFDDTTKGIAPELGTGTWNTSGTPAFVSSDGTDVHRSLNIGSHNGWTDTQGVLSTTDTAFTIAFRAKVGTVPTGLLFAFGSSQASATGGLAFRRGTEVGSFQVTVGRESAAPLFSHVPEVAALDGVYRTYAVTGSEGMLTLYVDGVQVGEPTSAGEATVLAPQFQWGSRHGNPITGESKGNGAIDALGVWKRALSAEEIAAIAQEMAPALEVAAFDFAVPEAWKVAFAPEPATAYSVPLATAFALGSVNDYRQTVDGASALTVRLAGEGVSGTTVGGESSTGATSTLTQDAWIDVASGAYGVVAGGSLSGWASGASNGAHNVAGNAYLRVESGASVKWLVGAGLEGNGSPKHTGNVGLVVEPGATVGTLVGAWTAKHGAATTVEGNVRILVKDVLPEMGADAQGTLYFAEQDPVDWVIGGAAGIDTNSGTRNSGGAVTGNVSLEVATEASGTFGKSLTGGAYVAVTNPGATASSVGSVALSLDAPNVTFAKDIWLAGYAKLAGDAATVTGDATLTLKGGAFTGTIGVGGGEGTVTVGGAATLEIAGASVIDLSSASLAAEGFDALRLRGDLILGANRLPDAALTAEGTPTLTLTLTETELADRRVALGRAETLPEGLTVVATNLPDGEEWHLALVGGTLVLAPRATAHTWQAPSEGTAWDDGLPGFQPGDDVTFAANGAQEVATLPADGARVGTLTVEGDAVLSGTGGLTADAVTVAEGGALTVGRRPAIRYLRLTPSGAVGTSNNNNFPGIAEFVLYRDGAPVAWPLGTTIWQENPDGSTIAADWTKNEPTPNGLIDGVYGASTSAPTYRNPADGSTGHYSLPSSIRVDYNKWWAKDATETAGVEGAKVVIALGTPIPFDAYTLWHTDHVPRSPNACLLESSADGVTWETLDDRTFFGLNDRDGESANAAYSGGPFAVALERVSVSGTLAVSGTLGGTGAVSADAVSFAAGSVLAVPAEGTLTLEGAVSGTATLDVSAWGELPAGMVRPVLYAPEGLTLTDSPEGYAVRYVDGCYWLARTLTQPLTLALGADAAWLGAAWQDASETPIAVAPKQWELLPATDVRAEVTAMADATLMLEAARTVSAFTVKPSEQTLTLGGAKLSPAALTVEEGATLSAATGTLALPSGATIGGTLTYDVASGSTALPALAGAGTLVKTGAGAFTVGGALAVGPTVEIPQGSVTVTAVNKAYSGRLVLGGGTDSATLLFSGPDVSLSFPDGIVLRNRAVVSLDTGRAWSSGSKIRGGTIRVEAAGGAVTFRGSRYGNGADIQMPIEGVGTIRLTQAHGSNQWRISGSVRDGSEGAIGIEVAKNGTSVANVLLTGDNGFSGGLLLREGTKLTLGHANAAGTGDVTVESDATLTVTDGTALNLHRRVGGAGTVSGAVNLLPGASLDASAATAEARLTVGTLTVAEGAAIPVTLPEGVTSGTMLLAWGAAPASADFVAAEETPLAPTAALVSQDDGLYYREMAFGTAGSDGADVATLSEDARRQLAAVAFAAGAASVTTVTGATASRPLTAAEIDAALTCFRLTPAVSVGEGGAATVTVAYDFGIATMAYDPATEGLTVAARVQGVEGAAATFAEGVRVELYAADDPTAALAVGEAAAGAAEVPLTVAPATARAKMARPLKVRAVAP